MYQMLVALCLKALEATTVYGSQNVYNTEESLVVILLDIAWKSLKLLS